MKTWLRHYNAPQLLGCVLALFYLIPGIIFVAWGWGKHKCPRCGALGKSVPASAENIAQAPSLRVASSVERSPDRITQLERLSRLFEQGMLTREEFEREKGKLLS